MKHDNAASWRATGSLACAKFVSKDIEHRDGAASGDPVPFRLPTGKFFDDALDIRDPEGTVLTNEIIALIAAIEQRRKKRRPVDASNHWILVRKILANGLRCHFHRRPPYVAYLRRTESYRTGPSWLNGRAIGHAVDLLVQAGLLTTLKGEPGTASTYRATEKLYSVAEGHGVTEQSLTLRLPPERLVRLRRGNFETPLLDFEPTANTNHWAVLLEAYNGFLAQQDIALDLSADEQTEWVKRLNKDRKRTDPRICRPELIQTDLYRQFCHASFEQGGRLYGGWWINAPKDLRKKITINGEPVAECDYSGCAIRMLYHENRIEYTDDPYWIGIVSDCEKAEGLPPGYFREGLKAITQTLLNGDMENRPENARISFSFKPYFSRPQVRKMLLEKHTPIASAFGSRAGLRLQRKDSDLALSIITDLREQGIVALPIHDSFLVPQKDKENLIKSMNYHYKEMIGFNPIIK